MVPSLLYVEDEEDDVYFMRRAFTRAGLDACLNIVADGQAAIDYMSGCGPFSDRIEYPLPTLILLDLNLPTVSGFQVLKWIRNNPAFLRLPVVIFSSSARQGDKARARELGASDYIEKPGSGLEFEGILEILRSRWLLMPRDLGVS